MARLVIISLAVGALALPAVVTPTQADAASCRSRKATGTVIGGLGGALLGNSISKGGGGLLIGGVGGALVGREIGKSGCHRVRTAYYPAAPRTSAPQTSAPERAQPVRKVYYDQLGNPVTTQASGGGAFQTVSATTATGSCRDATISFYDERGRLTQRPVQICSR